MTVERIREVLAARGWSPDNPDGPTSIEHLAELVADELERIGDRFVLLELAVSELNRRTAQPPATDEVPRTVFGIYVELADDVDDDRVRRELALLPRGLEAEAAVLELEKLGILRIIPDNRRSTS